MVEHKMKVLFTMPCSFIRSKERTNPFFDPIIRVCEEQGIQWSVIVPCKASKIGYPSKNFIDGRFLDWGSRIIWLFSKFFHLSTNVHKVYNIAGSIVGSFYGKRLKNCDLIIKVAGQFSEQLQGANPAARVADIQHGIIYSRHEGYFDDSGLAKLRFLDRGEIWLYGPGYADCFFKNPENRKWLDGRVKVVGDVARAGARQVVSGQLLVVSGRRNLVVIASQMTPDFDAKTLAGMKEIYERFLDATKSAGGVRVVFRHHPRFGNSIDLSDWTSRYDWVDFNDKRPWDEVYAESLCVATINSTCAFDAAAQGVPTILLDGASLGWSNLMVEEYNYPLKDLGVKELLAMSETDLSAVRSQLAKWFDTYYAPFSPDRCLQLLKGEI